MSLTYKVLLSSQSKKVFKKLDKSTSRRIIEAIEKIQKPVTESPHIKKIRNQEGLYRLRVGNYRVLFELYEDILLILVVKIGSRGDVYK